MFFEVNQLKGVRSSFCAPTILHKWILDQILDDIYVLSDQNVYVRGTHDETKKLCETLCKCHPTEGRKIFHNLEAQMFFLLMT